MESPKVSIHLVSYNQAPFVEQSLESVVSQDYSNLEVIASDDGSTDGTAEILTRYAARYPDRLRALTGERNVGITRNCNRALRECKGELIAFLAGDDYFLPGKISAQVRWFRENADAVLCGHQLLVREERTGECRPWARRLVQGAGPARWIEHGPVYGSLSIMIRSNALPARGFDERIPMVSDNKMWIDCLAKGGRYGCLPETYAVYRKHQKNFTNDVPFGIAELRQVFSILESEYPEYAQQCRRGRVNLIEYGLALHDLRRGSLRQALKGFLGAWKSNPRNVKVPCRIVQTVACMARGLIP